MERLVPEGAGDKKTEPEINPDSGNCPAPEIRGADMARGLNIRQNEAVYKKALLGFCKYENAAGDMLKLVRGGDREDAYQIAHSLKGMSGCSGNLLRRILISQVVSLKKSSIGNMLPLIFQSDFVYC